MTIRNCTRTFLTLAAVAMASFVFTVASADADLINVNIGGDAPASEGGGFLETEALLVGPAGGLGTTWNQFADDSTSFLETSTGGGTGVEYSTDYGIETNELAYPSLLLLKGGVTQFGRGNAAGTDALGTLTITGLDAGLYDIWLTSYREKSGIEFYIGDWTTTNTTSTVGAQEIDNLGEGAGNGDTFVSGVNFVKFENVLVTGAGTAVFLGTPDDNFRLGLNGFQIENAIIPEPGSLAVLGLGSVMMLVRRRRG